MQTAVTLVEAEIKTAILEYVKKEYAITLNYDSIKLETGMSHGLIVSADIQRPKPEKDPLDYRRK